MNCLRKSLYWVAALMLATVALAANAGTHTIALSVSTTPTPLVVGANTVSLTLTGNSNFSSLEIDWNSTSQVTVTSGTVTSSKGPVTGVPVAGQTPGGFSGMQFTFTNPQKTSAVITLNVTVTAASTCGAPQVTWQPYAWTGGVGTPSTSFTAPPTGTYTSNLPGATGCVLSFVNQPADAFESSVITSVPFNSTAAPVQVLAQQNGSTAVSGVVVSIGNTGACSISGSATTDGTGTAKLTGISSSAPGTGCALTATATGFTSATSNTFTVVQPQGTLSCTGTGNSAGNLNSDAAPPPGGADWGLKRGTNTDGTCGPNIPFTFSVNGANNTALFTEDSLGQPTSVEYVIRWAPVAVDSDGWSATQPCVSWGVENPVYQTDSNGVCFGDYVPALACLANDVNGSGDGTAVMPLIPNVYPFNASDPQYLNTTAKVCIAQQGWTSVSGQGVQYWDKVIDQADTAIKLP
jgi:hypothetical protein